MARGSIFTRTTEKGIKKYDCTLRINGVQKWKTFNKKRDAQDYLDHFSIDLRDGTYREIRKATFREYALHWKETHLIAERFKPSTLNSYSSVFAKHILPEFEHYGMQSISSAEINSFVAKLQKAKLGGKTVRNVLNLLNKFFKNAVSDRYLRHSPMEGVERPKISRKQKGRALQPNEVQALLANCEDDTKLIIMTAIFTGMRRGELFGLTWENVDFKGNVVRVTQALYWRFGKYVRPEKGTELFTFTTPKSEKSIRAIHMSPELKAALRERFLCSTKTGLVFCTEDARPRDPGGFVKRQFATAVKAAQLGKLRFHDLRHTYGSLNLAQGESVYDVQKWMGHSSIQVTVDIYGHPDSLRGQEAAVKMDTAIFGKKAGTAN